MNDWYTLSNICEQTRKMGRKKRGENGDNQTRRNADELVKWREDEDKIVGERNESGEREKDQTKRGSKESLVKKNQGKKRGRGRDKS